MASVLSRSCCSNCCESGDGGLRRLLLLHSFIDCLLRLCSLGLDLAARSSKFACECCGARLSLVELVALLLGIRRHRLRGLGFLHQSGGLLLFLLQGLLQFRDGALRRLLLFRGRIDCLCDCVVPVSISRCVPASSLASAAARP